MEEFQQIPPVSIEGIESRVDAKIDPCGTPVDKHGGCDERLSGLATCVRPEKVPSPD